MQTKDRVSATRSASSAAGKFSARWRAGLLGMALALGVGLATGAGPAGAVPGRSSTALDAGEFAFCTGPLRGQMFQRTELFFGRNSPTGPVSELQFQDFLDSVVTPLFPDGLTVLDAKGQFRASAGAPPEKEDAKLLILLYPYSKAQSDSVEVIRSQYKAAFAQQSVLRVDERSCISF